MFIINKIFRKGNPAYCSCGGTWKFDYEKSIEHEIEILDSDYARFPEVWVCDRCGKEEYTERVSYI